MVPEYLATVEEDRRRQGVERLLGEIRIEADRIRSGEVTSAIDTYGMGTFHGAHRWWNRPWPKLGNRTPPQAVVDGDEDTVVAWIEGMHHRSFEDVEKLRTDPAALDRLNRKTEELLARRR